jgi:ABC-type sugar transport system ATPase subunit
MTRAQSPVKADRTAVEPSRRLTVTGVTKTFGDTQALRGISLDARGGEILGVAGPNGAGKTTLIRIVAGEDQAESGTITLGHSPLSPAEAARVVSVVHQEVQLFPNLTVAENLVVESTARASSRRPRPGPAELSMLRELGINKYAHRELGACSLVVQQLTEIARVLLREDAAQVFLFDEPNSALTDAESKELFAHVLKLREQGKIVILVTHRLNELVELADRVVVIRDGVCAATLAKDALSEAAVARELVVGAEDDRDSKLAGTERASAAWTWSVDDWTHPRGAFGHVRLSVHSGEIVAVVGVEGSGVRELVRSLAGIEKASGHVRIDGGTASQARIGFLPAERTQSLFPNFSVAKNLTSRLGRGEIAGSFGHLRVRRLNVIAQGLRARFQVRCRSLAQLVISLSGGNQQKVAIAAALAAQPTLLVLEEPTRGVDVGAKGEIYKMLRWFVASGGGVVALCTEVTEVFELCNRVVVVDDGRVRADLEIHGFPSVTKLAERLATLTETGA